MSPIVHHLRAETSRFILQIPDYPENRFAGRGIVICAGGPTYFVQAWVTVCLLRELGCTLPIQVWHRDAAEMTSTMKRLLESKRVECINAHQLARECGIARLPGWAIKPFAIVNSRFREVLSLDSDSLPTRDPAYLFRDPSYQKTGSLFWTDRYRGESSAYSTVHPRAWATMNVPYRQEPECESGQLIVDKSSVWRELNLCLHFNQRAETYYRFVYGDKDTFRFAWHRLGRTFNTVPFGPSSPPNFRVLFQLDPQGAVVFQHRARAKWTVRGENLSVPGFQHQQRCLRYLKDLDQVWDQILDQWQQGGSPAMRAARRALASDPVFGCFLNDQLAGEAKFDPDGSLTSDVKYLPSHWQLIEHPDGTLCLDLMGDRAAPILMESRQGGWFGKRVAGRREAIRLIPRDQVADFLTRFSDRCRSQSDGDRPGPVVGSPSRFDCELLVEQGTSECNLILNVERENEDSVLPSRTSDPAKPFDQAPALDRIGPLRPTPSPTERREMIAKVGAAESEQRNASDDSPNPSANGSAKQSPGIDLKKLADAFHPSAPSAADWIAAEPYESPQSDAISFESTSWVIGPGGQPDQQEVWSGENSVSADRLRESATAISADEAWSGDAARTTRQAFTAEAAWSGGGATVPARTIDAEAAWSGGGAFSVDAALSAEATVFGQTMWSGDSQPAVAASPRPVAQYQLPPAGHTAESTQDTVGSYIKIYGMPRTCTNLMTHLIRQNFRAEVFANRLGWKHGPNLFREGDQINGCPLQFVVCVRHPYSWLVSLHRFEVQGGRTTCGFGDFVRGTCQTYPDRNPIERYNLLVRMWLALAVNPESAAVVRSETLQGDQVATLHGLADRLGLRIKNAGLQNERRRIGPDELIRRKEFDFSYYRENRFLYHYDNDLLSFVNQRLDHGLMANLQYRLLDVLPSPSIAPPPLASLAEQV